jgi:hypothetical protein
MASERQVIYIENLMREREIGDLADDGAVRCITAGQGEDLLSSRRASELIEMLLTCPYRDGRFATPPPTRPYAMPSAPAKKPRKASRLKIGSRIAIAKLYNGEI